MSNPSTIRNGARRGLNFTSSLRFGAGFRRLGLRAKFVVLLSLISVSSVALVGWYGYRNAGNAYREKAVQLAQGYTSQVCIHIGDFIELAHQDEKFISNNYDLLRWAYWMDIGVAEKEAEYHASAADTLRAFADAFPYYYKIRIVNNKGREILKIRRDSITGNTLIIPDNELEDISDQSFYTQALPLQAGERAVSTLDLNRLGGKIETPHVPILRVSTPLVGGNKAKYGTVIIGIRAEAFYRFIQDANHNEQGRVFYLIDQSGNYLFHPDKERMFGHILGHDANFERDFPGLLDRVKGHAQGVLTADGRIVAYQSIHPDRNDRQQYWLLVGIVPEAVAMAELNSFEYIFAGLMALVIFLVLAATRFFLGGLMTPLTFVTRQLQCLGRGEIKVEAIDYPAQDEIRDMVDSTHLLMAGMERLALQADAVGRGDFTGQAELLSEQDRLGNALNNMIQLLRAAKAESDRRNWLRDGLNGISQALTGDLSPQQLAEIAIGFMGHYLGAGRGVFYNYDSEQEVLDLLGSYMYTKRANTGSRFKLGEGAVGQAAREKKAIMLTVPEADAPPIVTGTAYVTALFTYTWPLLRDGELLGILELASLECFDELKLEFLNLACETIASFLYVTDQRERIKKLLVIAENAEREAREQNQRLQTANAQMEEQQQQLQQQAEELQQTNAQMEEQQQQLQQQTEELQQTNAQMEEQQQQLQQQTEELQQTNAQMEEQQLLLEQRNKDLTESQQELDAKAKQLEQSGRYKSEFLANMSHELRTPLNSIILLSKMMVANEDARLNDEEVKRAEVIYRSGQDLLRLINDVLDLSKVEAGRMVLNANRIASSLFMQEFRELFEQTAKERQLKFILEDRLQGDFSSDSAKLSQIVRNLLSNAFKFTKTGSVTLRIERSADPRRPIRISVSDTGIGIPDDKQQLIFEAFQQVDGSISREYGGTGLGLTISRRFAQLLGGSLELRSTLGQGSEFALSLPEALESFTETGVESAPAAASPGGAISMSEAGNRSIPAPTVEDDRANLQRGDTIILLIDDDSVFGQAVIDINRRLGYKTLLALDGYQGLELLRQYHPSGILLDLGLPDMDGTQVLHQIKTNPELSATPVYVISGRDRDAALLKQGIVGYLQKPVEEQQIAQAEAEVLAAKASKSAILVVENGGISAGDVERIVGAHAGTVKRTTPGADLAAMLEQQVWRLAVIDLNAHPVEEGLNTARTIRARDAGIHLVFFGERPLNDEDEMKLRQYSDSIIVKTPMAERRLLENIERFLKEVTYPSSVDHANPDATAKRLTDKRILVVDDDARNLFVITAALEQQGAKVGNAVNGRHALDFLAKNPVDLVIMDIMMPEMDGYQTIAELRANPALNKIPVLALTAKALPSDREKALASGADDYLSKPVDYDVLINMAAVWCGQHSIVKQSP